MNGTVKKNAQKGLQVQDRMKSASNGGVFKGSLQMLHVHVFLVAPLGTGHMAESGTDQHEGRIAIRESAHDPGAAADLPVETLDHIVGADPCPMFVGELTVSQGFFHTVLYLLRRLLQLHLTQLGNHQFSLFTGGFLAFLGMNRLKHLGYQLYFRARNDGEHIAIKVDRTALIFGVWEHFSHSFQHTQALVSHDELYAIQTTATQPLEETDPTGLVLFHTLSGA